MIDSALAPGAEIALDENQSRHVGTVLRLGEGDALRVFNARDGEWRATIVEKTKRGLRVRVGAFIRPARSTPDVDLLFAPVKRHATDLIIEKATELGVRRIRPVITQRTIAETVRLDRLQVIAREAAEQTERFDAPEILEPLSLQRALDGWDASRALIYADEAGDDAGAPWGGERGRALPLLEALQNLHALPPRGEGVGEGGRVERSAALDAESAPPPTPAPPRDRFAIPEKFESPAAKQPVGGGGLALLIGPEGGFAPDERRMLRALPFVMPVSLGPRILRAETAVIAALAVLQSTWGDWRGLDPSAE